MNKKAFLPSNAEKAFIYQQTQDLVAITAESCPISVHLEKNDQEYIVTFVLGNSPKEILTQSKGSDLMEVCLSAKNEMKKKLSMIASSLGESRERINFIDEIKKPYYFH